MIKVTTLANTNYLQIVFLPNVLLNNNMVLYMYLNEVQNEFLSRSNNVRYMMNFCRCGPCKVIAPLYEELSQKYLDVVFLKLDCNQDNKV